MVSTFITRYSTKRSLCIVSLITTKLNEICPIIIPQFINKKTEMTEK